MSYAGLSLFVCSLVYPLLNKFKRVLVESEGEQEAMLQAYQLLHGCTFTRSKMARWVQEIYSERKNSTRDTELNEYIKYDNYITFVVHKVRINFLIT